MKFENIILCSSLFSVLFLVGCGESLEKNIVGRWASEYSLPIDDKELSGEAKANCLSEFFPNKSVNHKCDFKMLGALKEGGMKLSMDGKISATGDWTLTDKTVYDKTIDGNFELIKFTVNGEEVIDKKTLEQMQKDMDSPFVKGETSTMVTLSNDGKKWVYETEIEKKKVTVTATKQ